MPDRLWIISPAGIGNPGFYRVRLVKGGPWVACRLQQIAREDRSWLWKLTLGDDEHAHPTPEAVLRHARQRDGLMGEAITEAEFRYLAGTATWAAQHAPDAPEANPKRRYDPLTAPLIF